MRRWRQSHPLRKEQWQAWKEASEARESNDRKVNELERHGMVKGDKLAQCDSHSCAKVSQLAADSASAKAETGAARKLL